MNSVAAAGVAEANRELVAGEPAATVGEDRRAAGQTCPLLLASAGGRTSKPAAVRSDAGPDRATAGTDGIDNDGQVGGIRLQRVRLRRRLAKVAEYLAIFGGAGADRIPIACTPDENLSTMREQAKWA